MCVVLTPNCCSSKYLGLRISFESAIADELVGEVEKSAAYASARLTRLRVTDDRRSVDVECESGAEDEVRAKVERLVRSLVRGFRSFGDADEELFRYSRRDDGPIVDAFAELGRRGWARQLGRGSVSLAGGAFALKRALDAQIRALALARFAAVEEEHPELLEPEVLARAGYLQSFPQSVSFVSHFTEDFDAIESFRASARELPEPAALTNDAVLRPAVCLPIYRALENAKVPARGRTITTTGRAFRYESKNLAGMHRLWDFSMREIVFIGSEEHVEGERARMIDATRALVESWDLEARLVAATDPFFATVRASKALWQRARGRKYEVVADIGGLSIAVGSINFAGQLFAHAFAIHTEDDAPATTACVGFGLERLVLALFAQHGFDAKRWPDALREVVFG